MSNDEVQGLEYINPDSEVGHDRTSTEPEQAPPQPDTETQGDEGAKEPVTYVGRRAAYHDGQLGRVFRRGQPLSVPTEDAERLTALGGDREVFVRSSR